MKTFCAWCKKPINFENNDVPSQINPVSHGICKDCAQLMFKELTEPIETFLDRFDMPILVIDSNEGVVTANKKAMKKAGLDKNELKGLRCGDVLQCVHAGESGGCGRTVHCQSCVIRNTVLYTHKTGLPRIRIPSFPDVQQYDNNLKPMLLISTEKVGELVLLKIEESPSDKDKA